MWGCCVGKQHHLTTKIEKGLLRNKEHLVICRDELKLVGNISVLKLYEGSDMAPGVPDKEIAKLPTCTPQRVDT